VLQDDVTVGGDQQVQTGSGIQGQGGDSFGGPEGGPTVLREVGGNGLGEEEEEGGGDGVSIDDSNVATGDFNQQAIDESRNLEYNEPEPDPGPIE
jgi:hypothetical protein